VIEVLAASRKSWLFIAFTSRGGSTQPLQLVQQWRYGEGEGEEDVDERRKMEREEEEEEISPHPTPLLPSIVFCIRHCSQVVYRSSNLHVRIRNRKLRYIILYIFSNLQAS
jgi:hypothetical protein